MVDGALERPYVAFFEPGTVGVNSTRVCDVRSCFLTQFSSENNFDAHNTGGKKQLAAFLRETLLA